MMGTSPMGPAPLNPGPGGHARHQGTGWSPFSPAAEKLQSRGGRNYPRGQLSTLCSLLLSRFLGEDLHFPPF